MRRIRTVVAIAPSAGNLTRTMTVNGHNLLGPLGIPFLAPWANRLDEQAFYANGKRYAFEHGSRQRARRASRFTVSSAPRVGGGRGEGRRGAAWVTSRLDFFKQPDWMAQFPFAHTIVMTHRLRDGVLDITSALHNLSAEPMPVAIGFHPYFRLTDSPRDAWTIALGARTEWVLAPTRFRPARPCRSNAASRPSRAPRCAITISITCSPT